MPTFIHIFPGDVELFAPAARSLDSMLVTAGQEITVEGELAEEQPADAYLIGEGEDARLWPHSRWKLVPDNSPASTGAAGRTSTTGAPATPPTPGAPAGDAATVKEN